MPITRNQVRDIVQSGGAYEHQVLNNHRITKRRPAGSGNGSYSNGPRPSGYTANGKPISGPIRNYVLMDKYPFARHYVSVLNPDHTIGWAPDFLWIRSWRMGRAPPSDLAERKMASITSLANEKFRGMVNETDEAKASMRDKRRRTAARRRLAARGRHGPLAA